MDTPQCSDDRRKHISNVVKSRSELTLPEWSVSVEHILFIISYRSPEAASYLTFQLS